MWHGTHPAAVLQANNGPGHSSFRRLRIMIRPSLALFLATAGLVAGTVACGRAPEPMEGGEAGEGQPKMSAPAPEEMDKEAEGGEGGEG
jgi:hypothetical protein